MNKDRVRASDMNGDVAIRAFKNKDGSFDPSELIPSTAEIPPVQKEIAEPEITEETKIVTAKTEQEVQPIAPRREVKEPSKRKDGQSNYKETFLKRNEIKTRQCVYISYSVHSVISRLVHSMALENSEITVGGYIDNVLLEHLELNRDEINELYRKKRDELI